MSSMEVFRYLDRVYRHLGDEGLLLGSTSRSGRFNFMTIGWGFLGRIWGKPYFLVAVRPSRYTYRLIEETGVFTVNVPRRGMEEVASYCGSVSGRDHDKVAELRLKVSRGRLVEAPVIEECPIAYECRVRYSFDLEGEKLPEDVMVLAYPSDDFHRIYFGEVVYMHVDRSRLDLL